jgi:long-chain acyl-CoA synthetase
MGLYDFTFYDLIARNALVYGNRPAWHEVDDGREVSFAEFKQQVDRLAAGLQQLGLQPGERVGVVGKNSLEFFTLYGAAAALGAVMLPINWRLSADEVAFNLNDCQPAVLFADAEFQEMIAGLKGRLPSVRHFFSLKPPAGAFPDFDSLTTSSADFQPVEVSADDGLVIIHTAAVEGRPRGALLSHRNLICGNLLANLLIHPQPEDVHLSLLPLFHIAGLSMAAGSFHAGILNVNISKFDAAAVTALIAAKRVSIMFDFAPILSGILERQAATGEDIGSLQHLMGLEAPEVIRQYQALTGGTFYCMYGQTETSAVATCARFDDAPGSAGKTVPLAVVQLFDERGRPVATGEIGEITVKGPIVFKGYWGLPEDTERTFRHGWHHTGDLGRFDADGYLWYEGRKADKELIKPGGENVYPAEVENAILQHPAVAQTVVFGVPDPKWKEGIKAVCRLKTGQALTAEELIAFVGSRIARYKKPQYVEFVEEMPTLKDGAIDRPAVKKRHGGPQQ